MPKHLQHAVVSIRLREWRRMAPRRQPSLSPSQLAAAAPTARAKDLEDPARSAAAAEAGHDRHTCATARASRSGTQPSARARARPCCCCMTASPTRTMGQPVPALANKHEVIVINTRGHGRSKRATRRYRLRPTSPRRIMPCWTISQIDNVALVGWSDDGIIGLDIAIIHLSERLCQALGLRRQLQCRRHQAECRQGPDVRPPISRRPAKTTRSSGKLPTTTKAFVNASVAMWYSRPDYKPEQLAKITTPDRDGRASQI